MNDILTFIAGCAIGGLLSWLITHRYFVKASADQHAELNRLSEKLRTRNTMSDFEQYLESSIWTKTFVDHNEVWVAKADNTFQIQQGERIDEFTERWTTVYPDPNSSKYPIYLKIGGTIVKELTFISMDGGRIFVPMADVRAVGEKEVEYFWNINSLAVKVCRIIGSYYIYEDLEGVAKRSKVVIENA